MVICRRKAKKRTKLVDGSSRKHEAGGWVGNETSFVLLQRLRRIVDIPVYVQGGIGLHSAGACFVAGAAGVVLDSQLLAAKESPLSQEARLRLRAMDGSESLVLGDSLSDSVRLYGRPDKNFIQRFESSRSKLLRATRHQVPSKRRGARLFATTSAGKPGQ